MGLMSDEPKAIAADFVTFRHVQGRKVLQLVLELPVEDMGKVFKLLGTPTSGESLWVAVAPMPKVEAQSAPAEPSAAAPTKEHRKFSELPLPQQAGIRCQDEDFWRFLEDTYPAITRINAIPKAAVCHICGVDTRSEIIHGQESGRKWMALEIQYQRWRTDIKFSEARR